MDDVFDRIDELARQDTDAAAHLAEEVLLGLSGEVAVVARALCAWGGVRRLQADWDAAEWAYEQAKSLLSMTATGPAEWLDWHGRMLFLCRDQRRLGEALDHAESMLKLSQEIGDPIRMAKTLVDEALVAWLIDPEVAKNLAEVALETLPESEVAYRRSALHVVLGCLCYSDSPDLDEVDRRLAEARAFGDPSESSPGVKLIWFEGFTTNLADRTVLGANCKNRPASGSLCKAQDAFA